MLQVSSFASFLYQHLLLETIKPDDLPDPRAKRANSLTKQSINAGYTGLSPLTKPKNNSKSPKNSKFSILEDSNKFINAACTMVQEYDDYTPSKLGKFLKLEECHKQPSFINVACAMVQECDDYTAQISFSKTKIYSFEEKGNSSKLPCQTTNPTTAEPINSQAIRQATLTDKFCRFCFETDEEQDRGKLICPCRCNGSLKHIHEECLKTWLIQRESSQETRIGAKCEICSYVYHLEARRKLKLKCSRACDEGFASLLIGIGLAVCLGNLLWLIGKYVQYEIMNPDSAHQDDQYSLEKTRQQKSMNKILVIVCSVLAFVFFIPMIVSIKRAFFEMRIVEMKIYNFDPSHHPRVNSINLAVAANTTQQDHTADQEVTDAERDNPEDETDLEAGNRSQQHFAYNEEQPSRNESLNSSNFHLLELNGTRGTHHH